jgi:DNA-binding NtrC family response regulator
MRCRVTAAACGGGYTHARYPQARGNVNAAKLLYSLERLFFLPRTQAMSRPRVLVVDDEPAICHAFALLLARHGFDVHTVQNRQATHAFLTEHRVDALVLDLRLRDSAPGDVIFQEAVSRDPSIRLRTLFITGDISMEARARIVACRCPYLIKPFDAQLLVDAVNALCASGTAAAPDSGSPVEPSSPKIVAA